MAMGNDELLARLRKLLEETTDTSSTRSAWQELLDQRDSVPARSIRAAEAVKGLVGSWAASWTSDNAIAPTDSLSPAPRVGFENKVGRIGSPEIDFVPYNWNTGAVGGDMSPSFVGHPVSWECVGAHTSSLTNFQWVYDGANTLTMEVTNPSYTGGVQDFQLVSDWYDTSEGAPSIPLFVRITVPGSEAGIPLVHPHGVAGYRELESRSGTGRYELFRIDRIDGASITLVGNKKLSDYFESDDGVGGRIPSITIIKPFVSRLAPIPDSVDSGAGIGTERVWAVVPPERSARQHVGAGPGWWGLGVWDGNLTDIQGGLATPIPKPLPLDTVAHPERSDGVADLRLDDHFVDFGDCPLGRFRVGFKRVANDSGTLTDSSDEVGRIIRIFEASTDAGVEMERTDLRRVVGWFEIMAFGQVADPDANQWSWYELRGHAVTSWANLGMFETGDDSWTPSNDREIQATAGCDSSSFVRLSATVHKPVSSLFADRTADIDTIESARLTGLIDPKTVGRTVKTHGITGVGAGATPARADRAIFDTRTGVDPGNLLDLGFRMVLYPAKQGNYGPVPDWDHPLHSREAVLDSTKLDELQYIEVDYDSGLVRLSHAPNPSAGRCDVDPNNVGIHLWAAYVPYSMEGGQGSTGIRLTGGDLLSANLGVPDPLQHDIIGERTPMPLAGDSTIDLTDPWYSATRMIKVPLRGVGIDPGVPATGYLMVVDQASGLPYHDVHRGPGVEPVSLLPFPSEIHYRTLFKAADHIWFAGITWDPSYGTSLTFPEGAALVPRMRPETSHRWDTTFGDSARADTLRFKYATLDYNADGSVTVLPTAVAGPAEELRAYFPLATSSEVARLHLEKSTGRWTTDDPPHFPTGHLPPLQQAHEVGMEISRGRLFSAFRADLGDVTVERVVYFATHFHKAHAFADSSDPLYPDSDTPSTLWRFGSSEGPDAGAWDPSTGAWANYGFKNAGQVVPHTEGNPLIGMFNASVEGAFWATRAVPGQAAQGSAGKSSLGHRYVINRKAPYHPSTAFWQEDWEASSTSRRHLQGPANPIHWTAFTPTGVDVPIGGSAGNTHSWWDLQAHMGTTGSLFDFSVITDYGMTDHARGVLAGRQTQAVPARSYLASGSQEIYPLVLPATGAKFILTVRSADPSAPDAWATIEYNANARGLAGGIIDGTLGAITCNDSDQLAAALNVTPHYDVPFMSHMMGAGFGTTSFNDWPSVEPFLLSQNKGEPPFVWVGHSDPRHIALVAAGLVTVHQVLLLCGGGGTNIMPFSGLSAGGPLYNVQLEIGTINGTGDWSDPSDLCGLLGGDFTSFDVGPDGVHHVPSCGLFFGESAAAAAASPVRPGPAHYGFESTQAFGNTVTGGNPEAADGSSGLGFHPYGSASLGFIVGSHQIVGYEADSTTGEAGTQPRWTFRLASGASAPTYGDQGVSTHPWRVSRTLEEPNRSSNQLGEWSWPSHEELTSVGTHAVGSAAYMGAGFLGAMVTFGLEHHGEERFWGALGDFAGSTSGNPTSGRGPGPTLATLAPHHSTGSAWGLPGISYNDIAAGDIITVDTTATGVVSSWSVRVVGKLTEASDDAALWVVMYPKTSLNYPGDGVGDGFFPWPDTGFVGSSDAGLWFAHGSASLVPTPASSSRAAVSHIIENASGGADDNNGFSSPYGPGIGSVHVGAGRLSIFSKMGPLSPTGLAFHTLSTPLSDGSSVPDSGRDFSSSVFLESGIFTTSARFGGHGQDAAGVRDLYRSFPGVDGSGTNTAPPFGGVGGLRVSGDAHVWVRNLRPLSSTTATAYVRRVELAGGAWKDGTFYNDVVSSGTAPAVTEGADWGSDHTPSGWSTQNRKGSRFLQEATITVALTRADLRAFQTSTANPDFPDAGDSSIGHMDASSGLDWLPSWKGEDQDRMGARMYALGQSAKNPDVPIFARSLTGCYLKLGPPQGNDGTNDGVWKIQGSPVITNSASFWHRHNISNGGRPIEGWPEPASLAIPEDGTGGRAGHLPASALIATMTLRVSRWSTPHFDEDAARAAGAAAGQFVPEQYNWWDEDSGHIWSVFRDEYATSPIWVADVVDPGGSPTGAPSSSHGMTMDPWAIAGKPVLPTTLTLMGLSAGTHPAGEAPPEFGGEWNNAIGSSTINDPRTGFKEALCRDHNALLLGIHDQMDHRGRSMSRAFIALSDTVAVALLDAFSTAADTHDGVAARMTVFASKAGELDDGFRGGLDGEFHTDSAGRVSYFGHPRRLGPGILMDAGLGLVQATAFRATPRAATTETVGSLTVFGRGAYPLPNVLSPQSNVGMALPSTFNRAEFYDEVMIASPGSRLVFESPWAGAGYAANWRVALAKSTMSVSPGNLARRRSGSAKKPSTGWSVQMATRHFLDIPVADTLFPVTSSGIRFKSPGTVVYERAFRPADASGAPGAAAWTASDRGVVKSGVPGMEIPVYGECLLLPKGPPSLEATGQARWIPTTLESPSTWDPTDGAYAGPYNEVVTPLDIPLYEFWNASVDGAVSPNFPISPRMTNADGAGGHPNWSWPDLNDGPDPHKGHPGVASQAYRHSRSREHTNYKYPTPQQIRILDGMIVEDVSNGTFYTAGCIGRWKDWPGANNSVGVLGDGVRSPVNGSIVVHSGAQASGEDHPEIIYDLSQSFNPELDPTVDMTSGFGDRHDYWDADLPNYPRRPLSGHRFRVTPNVEFVPVLGPRGVDGSLFPPVPITTGQFPAGYNDGLLREADAVFHSHSYEFRPAGGLHGSGDVGRTIYICGTNEYRYTGWWIIIDVLTTFDIPGPPSGTNPGTETGRGVAVLRKLNGRPEGIRIQPRADTLDGSLPLSGRSPMLHSSGNFQTNAHFAEGHFTGVPGHYGDLMITLNYIDPDTGLYQQLQQAVTASVMSAAGVTDAVSAANFLNSDVHTNGEWLAGTVGIPGNPQWIHWEPCARGQTGSLQVSYRPEKVKGFEQKWQDAFLGYGARLTVDWLTVTGTAVDHADLNTPWQNIGFYTALGSNCSSDLSWGDRNNASKMDANGKTSAANGLRWVFSAPLGEENTGSYVHLTRPSVYRFGQALASQGYPGVSAANYDAANDFPTHYGSSWSSGHQRALDISDTQYDFDLSTEIFRINRCPSTASILLGGDCEVYTTEIATTRPGDAVDEGRGQPIMYSPLGVWGNWPVTRRPHGMGLQPTLPGASSSTRPATTIDFPVMYSLQPIARERIVSVSPTSARSNPILERGRCDLKGVAAGPQGVGPMVASGHRVPQVSTSSYVSEPWQLVGRHDVQKTNMAAPPQGIDFNASIEVGNANIPDPNAVINEDSAAPTSTYCWTPAGEWWQLFLPDWHEYGKDASNAPPTLRIDLTESFTQAIAPGSGLGTPYDGREPRGARLNRIWVNFGVWGTKLAAPDQDRVPGFINSVEAASEQSVLDKMYMAFNLILEMPGSQGRIVDNSESSHPAASGTSGFVFGDRAPAAAVSDPAIHTDTGVGGTSVIPLYCNREAGDMMPNVMERWVTVGPAASSTGYPDWSVGDYEHGFGASSSEGATENAIHHGIQGSGGELGLAGNSYNPVLWGGMDFGSTSEGGLWSNPANALVLASVFPRSSRTSGGMRQDISSGIVPDGSIFSKTNPHSLSSATLTGMVVAHSSELPAPTKAGGGSYAEGSGRGPYTCPHGFTMALTPVGDPVDYGTTGYALHGRKLQVAHGGEEAHRAFKVGNWLDKVLDKYGHQHRSGSMLPPGARVFLEVAVGPGPSARDADPEAIVSAGAWVGGVKLSFDVETADGTAWTTDVNHLGDEEG